MNITAGRFYMTALVFPSESAWVDHGLEYNVAAQPPLYARSDKP